MTMMQVAEIEKAIAAIRSERDRLVVRAQTIADERKALKFDVFTANGVGKAVKSKLAKLTDEASSVAEELEAIEAALAEGERRRQSAREAEAERLGRVQAQRLAAELETFEKAGRDLHQALAVLVSASNAMASSLGRMNALGMSHPNREQFLTLGKKCLASQFVGNALEGGVCECSARATAPFRGRSRPVVVVIDQSQRRTSARSACSVEKSKTHRRQK